MRLAGMNQMWASRIARRTAAKRIGGIAASGLLASLGLHGSGSGPRRVSAQSATPADGASSSSFIVIRRYQLLPEASMDDLVERVNDGFVPIVKAIPGFQEYLFVDAGDGAHLTMSLYDDAGGAEQSTWDAAG